MMEYLGLASTTTISGETVCRYWCECCKIESQYVDTTYISYPSWATTTTPTYSTSTTSTPLTLFWKSPTTTSTWKTHVWPTAAAASGGMVTLTYEPDED